MARTPFSPDYFHARARFRAAAEAAGFRLDALAIEARGPQDQELTLDVAWRGLEQPRRAIVLSSGTHGVEGFLGSAVQIALLEGRWRQVEPGAGDALVLVHAMNPFGMAWQRRVNEDNIDLNRNFLLHAEEFEGATDGYRMLDPLLNPASPPPVYEGFKVRAVGQIIRHGFAALKGAVAVGQYDFPLGLFYGGHRAAQAQALLRERLVPRLAGARRVVHVDYHTGLGRRGTYKLGVSVDDASARVSWLRSFFGASSVQGLSTDGVLYPIRGVLGDWLQQQLPRSEYHCLLAEFGTIPILDVLAALRAENRAWHHGRGEPLALERARAQLREAFDPSAAAWREQALSGGLRIARQAENAAWSTR